jgi:HAD superfamily phosphatase (TIGR01668 family)
MSLLKPDRYAKAITDINPATLKTDGIENLLIDLEGTLVPRENWELPTPVLNWIKEAKAAGIKICLLSNTVRAKKIKEIAAKLDVPVIAFSLKPLPFSFKKALKILDAKYRNTAIIGDQLFMDVLGGKLSSLKTILVEPITKEKKLSRKLMRWVESWFFRPES